MERSGLEPRDAARPSGRRVFSAEEWRSIAGAAGLSPREFEIIQRVFDDEKESAIASGLGVSPHTVHTHLERLYRKLGVSGRCAAVVRVIEVFRGVVARDAPRPVHSADR